MDLLPAETPPLSRRQGFRSLKLVNISMEQPLAKEPVGVDYGVLKNGLSYYVRCNPKPRMRAALALAVKVGSVLEEDEERGVAHIVEHLAFSATKKYTNHDIIKFLESIGAEFGACQNALTSSDETIFEMLVPVDKPNLLSQAISVLAEFSTEVRVSAKDLEKERGAVLEEYRGGRNASGRMQDSHWMLMFEGSKYAERLPIGLEKVIRNVTPQTVKRFYDKWYHLHNMAVIAVGDFSDTQSVVELIKTHFGQKASISQPPPVIPEFHVPSHKEPRFSCFVESEAAGSAVMISCKIPADEMTTVKHYRDSLAEAMFHCALNQRFFKISRRKDPPYFSCSSAADVLVHPVKAYIMTSSCREGGTVEALESMLMEVARVLVHGFSDREISIVRALMMSEIESAFLERDQMQSTSLRDEYLQHFLRNEPVVGIEYEAQLQKTILPHISSEEVSKFAKKFSATCSCVIKIVEPHAHATVEDLKAVVSKVKALEDEGKIPRWDDEHVPEEIALEKPTPGSVIEKSVFAGIAATELLLSNGMRVCYKRTDFLDDQAVREFCSVFGWTRWGVGVSILDDNQVSERMDVFKNIIVVEEQSKHFKFLIKRMVSNSGTDLIMQLERKRLRYSAEVRRVVETLETLLNSDHDVELKNLIIFTGFAYGGLSELSEREYISCSMGSTISGEIGVFGFKPSVLMDMLAGKRAEVGTKVGAYMRTFSGDCSPSDLETALQLVYKLFSTNVEARDEEVKLVMQMAEETIRAQERDPYTAFSNRVRELNYGNSFFFRPIRIGDLKRVDPIRACEYFNDCFKDPSTFTVVIVGNIDPDASLPLILQYLGGIPKPPEPVLHFSRDDLKGLPFKFPETIVREVVHSPMVEAQCSVQLAFPVLLKSASMIEEIHFIGFLSKLLETKIMQILRFKHGQIYSVGVSVFLGGNKPSRTGDVRGDISVNFSCDPDISLKLVDLALDEISHLQEHGPVVEDISAILEIEQRAHENGLQENCFWLDRILRSYQSRLYFGDLDASFEIQDEGRTKVRKCLSPSTMLLALQRLLPSPCKNQYTYVILLPQTSRLTLLKSSWLSASRGFSRDAKILAGAAAALVLAITLWRYSRSALKS